MSEYLPAVEGLPLFDLAEGRKERDRALRKVDEGPVFTAKVRSIALSMEGDFTTEELARVCEAGGVRPKHYNAWGATINALIRNSTIIATGEYRQTEKVSSHARKTPVYRRGF